MFTVENLKEFLKQASLGIADAKDMLTQLDAQAGDGDLGVNMEQGWRRLWRQNNPKVCRKHFS